MNLDEMILSLDKAYEEFDAALALYAQTLSNAAMIVCAEIEKDGLLGKQVGKYTVRRSVNKDDVVSYIIDYGLLPPLCRLPICKATVLVFLVFENPIAGLAQALRDARDEEQHN